MLGRGVGGSRKTVRTGGRRGGGCAAPVILHQKRLLRFKKQPSQEALRDVRELAEALLLPENPCGCFFFSLFKKKNLFIFYFLFFIFGTLTARPAAPDYVSPEVEQAAQALLRLHL